MSQVQLSKKAFALLLRLLNSGPQPMITGEMLFDHFPSIAQELLDISFLIKAGTETMISVDDQFVDVIWCQKRGGYKYFSLDGWISVPPERVQRYALDVDQALQWIAGLFDVASSSRVTKIEDGVLSHLGEARYGRCKVDLYVASQLGRNDALRTFSTAIKREASRAPAIILNTSKHEPVIDLPLDVVLVPLEQMLERSGVYCALDETVVGSILNGSSTSNGGADSGIGLRFSADYRQAQWDGESHEWSRL